MACFVEELLISHNLPVGEKSFISMLLTVILHGFILVHAILILPGIEEWLSAFNITFDWVRPKKQAGTNAMALVARMKLSSNLA